MISYIKGSLCEILETTIVVECNGIGYNIEVPISVIEAMPSLGDTVKIYTYLNVREDAVKLFGFSTREDLEMFKLLISVSGLGPKGGLAILSTLSPNDLRYAIISEDAKAIAKAPGVGLKTAQKVIIEAKGKISMPEFSNSNTSEDALAKMVTSGTDDTRSEAIAALVALGYSNQEAVMAVRKVNYEDGMDTETILKQALKYII